jgi:3-oxoacyl-[acyl-carrier-protein] synthase I
VAAALALITGVGANTPIGRGAWIAAAAARAGLCGFCEHPYMIDTAGEPMRIARAPWLDIELRGVARFEQLLFPAIDEALQAAPAEVNRLALALGLPSARPGLPTDLARRLKQRVAQHYAGRVAPVLTFEAGHAAGLLALDAALKGLAVGSVQACIVAGVDSYIEPATLEWVEACDQLHGGGPLNNAWGFIPGEAAGALLLRPHCTAAREAPALAKVVGIGVGQETKLIKTDAVCIGEGLTQAFRAALAKLTPGQRIDNVYCDMNGEAYRADEYGFTCLRTKERFREAADFVAPADCWGDVGAAGGLLHALLAIAACGKGYAKGPLSMVWASSEGGERAAGVIHVAVAERE